MFLPVGAGHNLIGTVGQDSVNSGADNCRKIVRSLSVASSGMLKPVILFYLSKRDEVENEYNFLKDEEEDWIGAGGNLRGV